MYTVVRQQYLITNCINNAVSVRYVNQFASALSVHIQAHTYTSTHTRTQSQTQAHHMGRESANKPSSLIIVYIVGQRSNTYVHSVDLGRRQLSKRMVKSVEDSIQNQY